MSNAVVLITGATSGIGEALSLEYAAPGRRLLLVGRDSGRLDAVADRCRARGAIVETERIDVRDREALAVWIAARDTAAAIDLAIACAGIVSGTSDTRRIEEDEAVRAVLAINLTGVLNTVQPVVARMLERRRGHIAIVGSLAGLRGFPSSPAYSTAKAALHAYAEGIRPALRREGIAVSLIAPGFVRTRLNEHVIAPRPLEIDAPAAARIIRRGLDLGRPTIAFPRLLYIGLRLLALLPPRFGDWLLDRPGVDVPRTPEAEKIEP